MGGVGSITEAVLSGIVHLILGSPQVNGRVNEEGLVLIGFHPRRPMFKDPKQYKVRDIDARSPSREYFP
jgi:hypothetical protein